LNYPHISTALIRAPDSLAPSLISVPFISPLFLFPILSPESPAPDYFEPN